MCACVNELVCLGICSVWLLPMWPIMLLIYIWLKCSHKNLSSNTAWKQFSIDTRVAEWVRNQELTIPKIYMAKVRFPHNESWSELSVFYAALLCVHSMMQLEKTNK